MITIIGEGAWGKALASLFKENDQKFSFWSQGSKIEGSDIIVLAVPTQAIRGILENNKENLRESIIINSSKGIEKDTFKLSFQIIEDVLGGKVRYFSLIGPSFASEVERKMPTMVNLGSFTTDKYLNEKIKGLFQTEYFRVKLTTSVKALELAAAFKNIYAIACGVAEGLGFMANTRANLISLAYKEFNKLCQELNYAIDEDALGGIVGDLVLTCSSLESRNFRFGKLMVLSSVSDALKQINSTVEGYDNAFLASYFSQKTNLDLPLASFVYQLIIKDAPGEVEDRFKAFIKSI